jgi:hypothetical protein
MRWFRVFVLMHLYRRTDAVSPKAIPVWRDSFGLLHIVQMSTNWLL